MTNKEFAALERNADGRLIYLSDFFMRLTPKQIEALHEDDWSYYHELMEEVDYLNYETMREFERQQGF